jgi:hypothetical protein
MLAAVSAFDVDADHRNESHLRKVKGWGIGCGSKRPRFSAISLQSAMPFLAKLTRVADLR